MLKKIYTIAHLIGNFIFRRKRYILSFVAETDGPVKRWYYDFKHWGFAHGNLEMVAGADTLCEEFSSDDRMHTTVEVLTKRPNDMTGYTEFTGEPFPNDWKWKDRHIWGRTYDYVADDGSKKTMWICPVTLFVLGRYPDHLYIRKYD